MTEAVTSAANPHIRSLSRLKTRRGRQAAGMFLIEGTRELSRAIAAGRTIEEIVFCHRPSRTLLLTDLAFNVRESPSLPTRLWLRLNGVYGRFGPSRVARALIRDRAAARDSLDRILAWDFDRVVVSHGVVLESRGRRVLRNAYQWMG